MFHLTSEDILFSVDYHDKNCKLRQLDLSTGEERLHSAPTTPAALCRLVEAARGEAGPRGGRVVWVQESTTGWARMKELFGDAVIFELSNVLQMPLPPKGRRRKTDKIDTARIQRERVNGSLPLADQPSPACRQLRRLVGLHANVTGRRTGLRNWINRYLAHETWVDRDGLWTQKGRARLKALVLPGSDRWVMDIKREELEQTEDRLRRVEGELMKVYKQCEPAQRVDVIRGIGPIGAVCIVARIGDIRRFADAEELIGYAGLAPGVHQSDGTMRSGRLARAGVDQLLRFYLLEASMWARDLPRYQPTYQRIAVRRGKKIARIHVCRMVLRSIYKMLRDGVAFEPAVAAE